MKFSIWQYLFRYSLAKPGAIQEYKEALKNQSLSNHKLTELSWQKLQLLVRDAYENVPWYKQSFAQVDLHPDDIKSQEDFGKVPILTRDDLKDNFDEFISQKADAKKLKISTTGGSTGTPLRIGMDHQGIREIRKWQMFSWWSLSLNTNMATIYRGLPIRGLKKLALDCINWPQKVVRMDATQISKKKIDSFLHDFKKKKPQLVHGYVGALDVLADHILENSILLPSPKVIWATAAPISKVQELKISRAFNAPVCDQYGCSEIYFIAAECPHKNGLHIFSDRVKVEILDDNNQPVSLGTYGKIVLTNLDEYSFPLIRYENGDMGRLLNRTCSCGMSLPLMDKVKGRISDNIILPDETVLSGEYLTTIFDDFTDSVKQFQVVQHKSGNITVKVVFRTGNKKAKTILNHVKNQLESRINQQVKVSLIEVNSIPPIRGKLQFIIKE